jgi:putative molybdopterin biosynthesis protein
MLGSVPIFYEVVPEIPVIFVELSKRKQVLIVHYVDSKQIETWQDLRRPDIQFINRQNGAGKRVLQDTYLNLSGISRGAIRGYNQKEYTHQGVAAVISFKRAGGGLGIAAAAQALRLGFHPVIPGTIRSGDP